MLGLSVGDVVAHLRLNATKFNAAMADAQARIQRFSQTLTQMGSYLTLRVTLPLAYFGTTAARAFAKFDDAIVRSAAVTRGMNQEMRKEMEKTALQLSKDSLLSATQLAEGYFALGQAGYSAAEAIKILPIAEEFAIASTIELDASIRYLARTAEGLGMAMEDPVKMMESMEDVSNAFTFAAITTTAEIHDFAVAMTHAAAPALKLVNKGIKEGVAVLMAFARAGIVAEEAGTLLWTTVRDLQRAYIKSKSVWMDFGLTVYDTTGTMRNLADIFADVEAKFSGMSDEAKKTTLQLLGFQDRSLRGIQALMGFAEEMKIFQEGMSDMGDLTKQVADTYMKSFEARLIKLGHRLDVMRISIGRMLSPFIEIVGKQIEKVTEWWESLTDATKMFVVEMAIAAAVIGPVLLLFGKLVAALGFMTLGFQALSYAMVPVTAMFSYLSWPVLAVVAALIIMAAKLYVLRALWLENWAGMRSAFEFFADGVRFGLQSLEGPVADFVRWFGRVHIEAFNYVYKGFTDMLAGIASMFVGTIAWLKEMMKGVRDAMTDPSLLMGPAGMFFAFTKHIAAAAGEAKDAWAEAFTDMWNESRKAVGDYEVEVLNMAQRIADGVEDVAGITIEELKKIADVVKKQLGYDAQAVIDMIMEKIEMMNENLMQYLPDEELNEVLAALKKVRKEVAQLGDTDVSSITQQLQELMQATRYELELIGKSSREREKLLKMYDLQIILEKEYGKAAQRSAEQQEKYNKAMAEYNEILTKIAEKERSVAGLRHKCLAEFCRCGDRRFGFFGGRSC
jgi:TP901 family phage tail tape measure protein